LPATAISPEKQVKGAICQRFSPVWRARIPLWNSQFHIGSTRFRVEINIVIQIETDR
jgi:hypothetical protein